MCEGGGYFLTFKCENHNNRWLLLKYDIGLKWALTGYYKKWNKVYVL